MCTGRNLITYLFGVILILAVWPMLSMVATALETMR
jgi:hypothetical protein